MKNLCINKFTKLKDSTLWQGVSGTI